MFFWYSYSPASARMVFHSCGRTGWTDRRDPLRKSSIFFRPSCFRNESKERGRENLRTSLMSTMSQVGFAALLFGSKCLSFLSKAV